MKVTGHLSKLVVAALEQQGGNAETAERYLIEAEAPDSTVFPITSIQEA